MAWSVGDSVPDVPVWTMDDAGPRSKSAKELLGEGRLILIGVPGAFTPSCSDAHLPGYVARSDDLRAAGIVEIFCTAVNDAFVMGAWAQSQQATGRVTMLADGNGQLAHALGLVLDGTAFGLGTRCQRFAAVLDDGVVEAIWVEPDTGVSGSSAESVLAHLREPSSEAPSG